jgi:hypothetical protein
MIEFLISDFLIRNSEVVRVPETKLCKAMGSNKDRSPLLPFSPGTLFIWQT